jgi:hypothetical protein
MNARLALCLVAAACAAPALAHGDHSADAKTGTPTTTAAPAMSADDMEMMKAWEKASTPGKEHQTLAQLEGTFDASVSSWMKPGAPVEKSTGRSENRMIFGGRQLESRFSGTFMGQPFEGVAYTGYDNVTKKYTNTWMDSMATGSMRSEGTADASGKTMTFHGECHDPVTGKAGATKEIFTIESPNRYTMEMWATDPKSGDAWKAMEIVYSRTGTAKNAD